MSNSREQPLVALIGFLDTKLEEHILVQGKLKDLGCDVRMIDVSIRATSVDPARISVSIGPGAVRGVAKGLGAGIDRGTRTRADELDIMIAGATEVVLSYQGREKLCGIMGLGGSTTTSTVTSVMRCLKIGLPKLVVSTMASGDVSAYVGESDITIMPSIGQYLYLHVKSTRSSLCVYCGTVDISGKLNDISIRVLKNACAAMAGMAHEYMKTFGEEVVQTTSAKRIAITMFGLTTPGVNAAMKHLTSFKDPSTGKELYDPVVFHATGSGGRTMERLVEEGVGLSAIWHARCIKPDVQ